MADERYHYHRAERYLAESELVRGTARETALLIRAVSHATLAQVALQAKQADSKTHRSLLSSPDEI